MKDPKFCSLDKGGLFLSLGILQMVKKKNEKVIVSKHEYYKTQDKIRQETI